MAQQVDWSIQGVEYSNCNCAYGCPCQFEARPTQGHCRGLEAIGIDAGHFGEVRLDGLRTVLLYAWPGAIYEGGGAMQAVIDERADARQREALIKILHGEETEPGATHWWVYRSMATTAHPPLFAPIEIEVDVDARTARLVVPGVVQSEGGPIRSPATGEEHRALIVLPDGIEFTTAEMGSGTTKASGAIEPDHAATNGQVNRLNHTGSGKGEPGQTRRVWMGTDAHCYHKVRQRSDRVYQRRVESSEIAENNQIMSTNGMTASSTRIETQIATKT